MLLPIRRHENAKILMLCDAIILE